MARLPKLRKNNSNIRPGWSQSRLVDQTLQAVTNDAYHRCVAELYTGPISSLLGGGNPSNYYYLEDLIHAELVTEIFERVDRRRIFRIPEAINYDLLRSDIKNATTKLESRIESQFARDRICKNMDYLFSDWLVKLTDNVSKYSAAWFDEDYEWEHHDNYATSFDEGQSILAFLVRSIERGAIRDKDFISKISTYRDRMSGFEERLRPLLPKLRELEFDSFQQDNLAPEWRWWRQ